METMSPSQSRLNLLHARPPTPPRDIHKTVTEAIEYLDDSYEVEQRLAKRGKENRNDALDTPLSTPASHHSDKDPVTVKKVEFSLSPTYVPSPIRPSSVQLHQPLQSRITDLKKLHKPLKSILKLPSQPVPPTPEELDASLSYFSLGDPNTFGKMLKTVVGSLASNSTQLRLDAYLGLNGALKAHDGIPDAEEVEKHISRLQQFLARDISWKDETGKLDVNIVQQALKLAATFLHDPRLSKLLDDDFKAGLLDRSITVLETPDMPKVIVKHHAYLLGWQVFPAHFMTSSRVDKIITALQTIEQRCSGNSVLDSRLTTYQRLLERQQPVMLSRMRDWIRQVVQGLLHPVSTIRSRAIETC